MFHAAFRPALAAVALAAVVAVAGCYRGAKPATPEQAETHVARAMVALDRGDLDRAEAELTLALEYDPNLATAFNGLGLVARRRGDAKAAAHYFSRAIALDDDLAEAHSNLGVLALEAGNPAGAEEQFRAALAIDPGYPAARHNLARTLMLRGKTTAARSQLLRLTSADENNADGWAELGLVELAMGHVAAAERAVRTALAIDPDHAIGLRARADIARAGGDYEAALADYGAALDAAGAADADALTGRGVTYLVMGRYAPAVEDLSRAARLAPNSPAARFGYGAALAATGDDEGAARELGYAIDLRAGWGARYAEAHLLRAQSFDRLGDRDQAVAEYEAFVTEADGDPALAEEIAAARRRVHELRAGR
jgi:tetratricopeptide (TPR) repeat protein